MKKSVNVVGAVIQRDGRIFAAQRSAQMSLPLTWEFPGGKVEPGESPEAALARELSEELKCEDAKIGSQVTTTTYEYEFAIVTLTTFLVDIGDQSLELVEHAASKWVLPAELDSLDWAPADVPAVDLLKVARAT